MTYTIHPKIYRLNHEIKTLERLATSARQRIGMSSPAILQNYKEMIQVRKELILMLNKKHERYVQQRLAIM
ncbi:MAG: hypothetical protein ACJA0E_000618 [Bermanella sp.]|jgi:hypothetical protein